MTKEELKKYNGKDGNKAYVAFEGKVYDVTESELWTDGNHEDMHMAGEDLTESMEAAPHAKEVFDTFKQVDTLEAPKEGLVSEERMEKLRDWYYKFHPHPVTAHFPIALHIYAGIFNVLFLFDKTNLYEQMVFYSLAIATIAGIGSMITGLFSWWVNYNLSRGKNFIIKIYLANITLVLGLVGMGIYFYAKESIYTLDAIGIVYHSIVFLTVFSVMGLGYYGGKISWPAQRSKTH